MGVLLSCYVLLTRARTEWSEGRQGGHAETRTLISPLELERRREWGMPCNIAEVSLRSLVMYRSA